MDKKLQRLLRRKDKDGLLQYVIDNQTHFKGKEPRAVVRGLLGAWGKIHQSKKKPRRVLLRRKYNLGPTKEIVITETVVEIFADPNEENALRILFGKDNVYTISNASGVKLGQLVIPIDAIRQLTK